MRELCPLTFTCPRNANLNLFILSFSVFALRWLVYLFFLFFISLLKIVAAHGKSYIIWQDVIDNEVKVLPDTVVNIWKTGWKKEMEKVTSKGLRAILSSCWYLNRIRFGDDWTPVSTRGRGGSCLSLTAWLFKD